MSLFLSGFTLVRQGVQFDYPFLESLRSMLPIVDELIINVGQSDDSTLETLQSFVNREGQGKIKIFETQWNFQDPKNCQGGSLLAQQTNLALDRTQGTWCLYLQADEILHEIDYPALLQALRCYELDEQIEGLLFDYVHFYGSFDVIQHSRSTYRREVRVIKKSAQAQSVGDAQSFRKKTGEKLQVAHSQSRIFHYGWVRKPEAMREKTFFLDQLYHGAPSSQQATLREPHTGNNYRYKKFWGLYPYRGTHPSVMQQRIQNQGWHWNLKEAPWTFSLKDFKKIISDLFERMTGIRLFEYKNYHWIKSQPSERKPR